MKLPQFTESGGVWQNLLENGLHNRLKGGMEAQSLLSTRGPPGLEAETYSQWVVGAEDERALFKYEDQGKSLGTFE